VVERELDVVAPGRLGHPLCTAPGEVHGLLAVDRVEVAGLDAVDDDLRVDGRRNADGEDVRVDLRQHLLVILVRPVLVDAERVGKRGRVFGNDIRTRDEIAVVEPRVRLSVVIGHREPREIGVVGVSTGSDERNIVQCHR